MRVVSVAPTLLSLGLAVSLGALAAGAAHAASAETAAIKRGAHRGQPSQTAPDRTGSIARAPNTFGPPAPLVAEDETSLVLYYLPDAPRSRVRACGERWRAKRLAGETGDENWRDFAAKCLVAVEGSVAP